jgi:acyl-CoA dehydrogenase
VIISDLRASLFEPSERAQDGLGLPNLKYAPSSVAIRVVDRAIEIHGGMALTDDTPLAVFFAHLRAVRIADGPDEVHKRTIARQEQRRQPLRSDDAARSA